MVAANGRAARSQHARVKRGGSLPVELVGTDEERRKLTYNVLTQPEHGNLDGTTPNLTYTPEQDYLGQDQFTFKVAAGELESAPATVRIDVQPADKPPTITTQPVDAIVGAEQPASFRVIVSGTPPFSYQWNKNGKAIPRATGPGYSIRKTTADGSATYSVTVTNAAGSVLSRNAALQLKPLPGPTDDVPVIGIKYKSPVVEPATAGVLTLTRTGNTTKAVTVNLLTRSFHDPVIADINYVPVATSIALKAGQTTAEIRVTPIDDTLAGGTRMLLLQIVPNPAYRVASKQLGSARMTFLDDDCPDVGISVVKNATPRDNALRMFQVTARPAPRRDTRIAYSVGGTAIGGVDYEALAGTVTIPAGGTTAMIVVKPYKPAQSAEQTRPAKNKTVVLTLPHHQFTYFDFYGYLTQGRSRTASVAIAPSDASPAPPKPSETPSGKSIDVAVKKLRGEVSRLGWIVFTARSDGPDSDFDLFVMRPDGSHLWNITNTPKFDEYSARVSPGGKRILYRQLPQGVKSPATGYPTSVGERAVSTWPPSGVLVMANADGHAPKPIGGDGACAWATWGPDGKRIACLEQVELKEPAKGTGQQKAAYQIVIREADTLKVVRELPSAGIYSQAIWSPDGKRICGPADILPGKKRWAKGIEYPLGVGKMASLDIESGKRTAMARFPDWFPVWATDSDGDWFQGGSPEVLHSANNYGICPAYYAMLWRSGLEGKPSELVFGEDMKHVWGGCTSPDDKYAIFVIGGETWPLQGKMAIIRLADAPIARGRSKLFHEVLADYFPNLKQGPVLDLADVPEGFEPHWTLAEFAVDPSPSK